MAGSVPAGKRMSRTEPRTAVSRPPAAGSVVFCCSAMAPLLYARVLLKHYVLPHCAARFRRRNSPERLAVLARVRISVSTSVQFQSAGHNTPHRHLLALSVSTYATAWAATRDLPLRGCLAHFARAPFATWLTLASAFQGVGGAAMLPNSLALLNGTYSHDTARRAKAVGWWTPAGAICKCHQRSCRRTGRLSG
jgi:MFS family permease